MWELYINNPSGRHVGDCTVRALCKALDLEWDKAYMMLAAKGFEMCDMPSSNAVFGAILKEHGFKREVIPNECPDCYTLEDFAEQMKELMEDAPNEQVKQRMRQLMQDMQQM